MHVRGVSCVASIRLPFAHARIPSLVHGHYSGWASSSLGRVGWPAPRPGSGRHFAVAKSKSLRSAPTSPQFRGGQALGRVGEPSGLRQTAAMLAKVLEMSPPHNMSIDADPQQQEAASPLMLVVRSFLR
jgi:hypothetical protein